MGPSANSYNNNGIGFTWIDGPPAVGTRPTAYSYYPNGQLKTTIGRAKTTYAYNGRGLLTALKNDFVDGNTSNTAGVTISTFSGPSTSPPVVPTLLDLNYIPLLAMPYDSNGNRLNIKAVIPIAVSNGGGTAPEASRNQSFSYNPSSELTSDGSDPIEKEVVNQHPVYNDQYNQGFNPDGGFNLDPANFDNQLTYPYSYDANGNQANDLLSCNGFRLNLINLGFDIENRLTSIQCPAMTFGYDGDGLRAWKIGPNGAKTYFLNDGDDVLLELNSSGAVIAANGYAADGLRTRYNPADNSFLSYTYDPEGSVVQRLRTDSGGATDIMDTTIYDAYGNKYADFSTLYGGTDPGIYTPTDPAGFGGQHGYYTDPESGLVLMTHRYYDPNGKRFLTRDPIGYKGGINLYGFCGNNPVMESDPSGFSLEEEMADNPYSEAPGGGNLYQGSTTDREYAAYMGSASFARPTPARPLVPTVRPSIRGLYARTSFRPSAVKSAIKSAPKTPEGHPMCPTCGKTLTGKVTIQTKKGPVQQRAFDLDHHPETWKQRKQKFQARPVAPSRKEVVNSYNTNLRVQCPSCNRSNRFNGIAGAYSSHP